MTTLPVYDAVYGNRATREPYFTAPSHSTWDDLQWQVDRAALDHKLAELTDVTLISIDGIEVEKQDAPLDDYEMLLWRPGGREALIEASGSVVKAREILEKSRVTA